jgi:branched-chain amino acid aminotransferase
MSRIWVNGRLVDATQPAIAAADRGFLLGDGLFETIRVQEGAPLCLERHLARLARGGALLDLPLPGASILEGAVGETIDADRVRGGSLRLTVTRGVGERGLDIPASARPTVLITVSPGAPMTAPVRVRIDRQYRRDERSPLSAVKALGYLPSILARRGAQAQGADDALLLNVAGRVACATAATLVLWRRGVWITPAQSEGALPGTARAALMEAGLVAEGTVSIRTLLAAPAAMLVNALGARAVLGIDARSLPWPEAVARSVPQIADVLQLPTPPHRP